MKRTYEHLGIIFDESKTPKYMNKNNFVNRDLEKNKYLTDFAKSEALRFYDMNMEYFKNIKKIDFNMALDKLLDTHAFVQITNLNDLKGEKGIYILVLDKYKQIYIGQSRRDLKQRILRHFYTKLPFQGVPFISFDTLPIDCFKPKDITRIYVIFNTVQKNLDEIEIELINIFPNKLLLNKIIGGKPNNIFELCFKMSVGSLKKEYDTNNRVKHERS